MTHRDSRSKGDNEPAFARPTPPVQELARLRVRRAVLSDLDAIVRLHHESFSADDSLVGLLGPGYVRAAWKWAIESPLNTTLVADDDGRLEGVMSICERSYFGPLLGETRGALVRALLRRPWIVFDGKLRRRLRRQGAPARRMPLAPGDSAQVFLVAVARAARGRGVFGFLSAAVVEHARVRGLRIVRAGVRRENLPSQRAFTEGGWVELPGEATADTLVCARILDPTLEREFETGGALGPGPTSPLSIAHVAAHGALFTQYRMPILRAQKSTARRLVLICPDDEASRQLRAEGFEVVAASLANRPGLTTLFEIHRLRCWFRDNPVDLVVGHQPMGALVGIVAGRLAGVPARVYSTGGLKHQPGLTTLRNRLLRRGELALIALADAVLLVNREDERALRAIPATAGKAHLVGPLGGSGLDLKIWNPATRESFREASRKELGLPASAFAVAFAGRLVWEKGFRDLIAAARRLPPSSGIVVVVFGRGPDGEAITAATEDAGVASRFRFVGYRRALDRDLAAADAFVLPSYREGMPVSLLQALALGLPSIATDIRGSRELVGDCETGLLVPAHDPEALADAILRLSGHSDDARRFGEAGARQVADCYSEDVLAPRTVALVETIARRKLAAAGPQA